MTLSHERRPPCLLPLLCWDRRAVLSACLVPISHSQPEQSSHINWTPYHELVATKCGHAASQSVEIYQGQHPTALSHTARPEYNPALIPHPVSLMNQAYAMIQSCWYVCVFLCITTHTHRLVHPFVGMCTCWYGTEWKYSGSLCWRIDGWWQTSVFIRFLMKANLLNWFICS